MQCITQENGLSEKDGDAGSEMIPHAASNQRPLHPIPVITRRSERAARGRFVHPRFVLAGV